MSYFQCLELVGLHPPRSVQIYLRISRVFAGWISSQLSTALIHNSASLIKRLWWDTVKHILGCVTTSPAHPNSVSWNISQSVTVAHFVTFYSLGDTSRPRVSVWWGAHGEHKPVMRVWGRALSGVQGHSHWSGGQGGKAPWSWKLFLH